MATQIQADLFIGDLADARIWEGSTLFVQELRDPTLPARVIHLPVFDPQNGRALFGQLEAVLCVADDALKWRDPPLLIACGDGLERAPVAAVWFLYRKRGMSVPQAYRLVRERRPEVVEHFDWLFGPGFWKWW
jgi:protein-tyrosine phosphatase